MDTKKNSLDAFLWNDESGLQLRQPVDLYHYTVSGDTDKIRQQLKCRNSAKQEDGTEFQLGLELLKDLCFKCQIASKVRCWTFSLCTEKNNRQMLGKYSCSKPGCPEILKYDFADLRNQVWSLMDKAIINKEIYKKGCYYLLPCLYQSCDAEAIEKLKRFLFGNYLSKLNEYLSLSGDFLAEACSHIFRAMIKKDEYSFEQEYRLVRITFDNNDDERIPFGFSSQPQFTTMRPFCSFCDGKEF